MDATTQLLIDRLREVPPDARKLFCVIVQQAYHGPIHPKLPGVATPAEILEACGLDVGEFYSLLAVLANKQLILVSGDYPFEEIRLAPEASVAELVADRCLKNGVPLQEILVGLQTGSLPK
jgi:2-keto-3-deoxy-6-phosphogluconate aldolase